MRNNIVGERVKLIRKHFKPKMTQNDLAARLELDGWNIGRSGIAKIEVGLRQVTDIEVIMLARALSVPPGWLLDENEYHNQGIKNAR